MNNYTDYNGLPVSKVIIEGNLALLDRTEEQARAFLGDNADIPGVMHQFLIQSGFVITHGVRIKEAKQCGETIEESKNHGFILEDAKGKVITTYIYAGSIWPMGY